MTLGEKIIELRNKENLSQKDLAIKLNVLTGTIAEWESNESTPSISDISKLSSAFSVTIDSLIDEIDIENKEETTERIIRKSFFKQIWFWIVIAIVIIATVVTTILLLNCDVKPKIDENGNPVFVELTNEVYTNAKEYLGYHINIKGKVFQVMGDNGNVKGIQIWLDPDTCEQNLMIYYNTDVEVKQGDYIMCSGYIDSLTEYKNSYNAKMHVPLVYSSDLKKATYIDVMAPTIATITPENLKQEKLGYSVLIDKIEFSKKETRVYATVTNNGKALLYVGDAVIVQDGKQYNSTSNYEANYEEIPYEIVQGVSSSGIIVFSAISTNDFEMTISVHSDDYDEGIDKFTFKISKNGVVAEKPVESKPTTNSTTSTTTPIEKPQNRNQEAILEAINVANKFFPTNRNFVESVLLKPSLEEGFDDFSYEEASYAIKNADINWGKHAATTLSACANDYGFWTSPNDLVHNWLDNYESFTDAEIKYAINNCGVNWNNIALKEAKSYIEEYKNNDEHITTYDIIDNLSLGGFSDESIMYAIDNTDGYDKGIAEEPEERATRLSGYGYSREEIIQDFISGGWTRENAEKLVDNCGIQ